MLHSDPLFLAFVPLLQRLLASRAACSKHLLNRALPSYFPLHSDLSVSRLRSYLAISALAVLIPIPLLNTLYGISLFILCTNQPTRFSRSLSLTGGTPMAFLIFVIQSRRVTVNITHYLIIFISITVAHVLSFLVMSQHSEPHNAVGRIVFGFSRRVAEHFRELSPFRLHYADSLADILLKFFRWRHSCSNIWSLPPFATAHQCPSNHLCGDPTPCTQSFWHSTSGDIAGAKHSSYGRHLTILAQLAPQEIYRHCIASSKEEPLGYSMLWHPETAVNKELNPDALCNTDAASNPVFCVLVIILIHSIYSSGTWSIYYKVHQAVLCGARSKAFSGSRKAACAFLCTSQRLDVPHPLHQ